LTLYEPKRIPFVLKSLALFIITRSTFVLLTHIGPFPDQIPILLGPNNPLNRFIFGGDCEWSLGFGVAAVFA
jgi:hypothetical protein